MHAQKLPKEEMFVMCTAGSDAFGTAHRAHSSMVGEARLK